MTKKMSTSRRSFLRGAAGSALALPFLRSAGRAEAQVSVPKRLIVWFTPCGFDAGSYPTSMSLAGTSLAPLAPYASDLIVTRGLSMRSAWGQGSADHPTGFGHLLTGNHCDISSDDVLSASNASLDQFVANRMGLTRRATSLHGISSDRTMSYDAGGNPVRPENDPRVSFDRLFAGLTTPTTPAVPDASGASTTDPELRRRSILSAVQGSYDRLRCRLGSEDRVRVDAHLGQIEDIARRLDGLSSEVPSGGGATASCSAPTLSPTSSGQEAGRLHAEILVRAMACDVTRVGTMQWYSHTAVYGASYDWGGLGSHHGASHGETHRRHDENFAGELAYLLELLRTTEAEDGQPLLHHTAVLCVSELALNTHLHHLADMGVILAGQAGGALSTGRYIDFLGDRRGTFTRADDWRRQHEPSTYFEDFDVPHNRLLVELVNMLSEPSHAPINHFGATDLVGGLPQLRGA